jgi:hypothetical protein
VDTVRIVRIMEYVGPRDLVENTLACGAVAANGTARHGLLTIRSATMGDFAEILETKAPTYEEPTL